MSAGVRLAAVEHVIERSTTPPWVGFVVPPRVGVHHDLHHDRTVLRILGR